MFNVELHLISNACRSTENPIEDINIDAQIREIQEQCALPIDMEVGGKKTKKRKHRRTRKRKHLYKKIKTRKYKK